MTQGYEISTKDYDLQIENTQLSIKIHKLLDSFFVYIGNNNKQFLELSVSMPSKTTNTAISSTLFTMIDSQSDKIAKRLATKFKLQFFVSFSLEMSDLMLMQVEQNLIELIKELL